MPLPCDANEAIERLLVAISKLKQKEAAEPDRRRLSRDVGKYLKHLSGLFQMLHSIGISPPFGSDIKESPPELNRPLYISIDLGLRQRRKHFHGQIFFQGIAIPNDYLDELLSDDDQQRSNEQILSSSKAFKIAEGGRYDDLVRRSRPPGNFGSALFNEYTGALIPKVCATCTSLTGPISFLKFCFDAVRWSAFSNC
jgi:hypothetical protein